MELQGVLGWLAAAAVAVWTALWRNRQTLLLHAAEAVAFAEKFYWGSSEETLEAEAVRYFEEFWPSVPAPLVRVLVREVCRRRKLRAHGMAAGR